LPDLRRALSDVLDVGKPKRRPRPPPPPPPEP
jgi:hypothetical protein